jgi:hypothetical protein
MTAAGLVAELVLGRECQLAHRPGPTIRTGVRIRVRTAVRGGVRTAISEIRRQGACLLASGRPRFADFYTAQEAQR